MIPDRFQMEKSGMNWKPSGKLFIPSKQSTYHGKSREIYEPSVYTGATRKAGKVEREVRGVLVGGLYSEVGRDGRIRLPDVSSTRQRTV